MSSFVNIVPEELASASEQLSGIAWSWIKEATSSAAPFDDVPGGRCGWG